MTKSRWQTLVDTEINRRYCGQKNDVDCIVQNMFIELYLLYYLSSLIINYFCALLLLCECMSLHLGFAREPSPTKIGMAFTCAKPSHAKILNKSTLRNFWRTVPGPFTALGWISLLSVCRAFIVLRRSHLSTAATAAAGQRRNAGTHVLQYPLNSRKSTHITQCIRTKQQTNTRTRGL